MVLQGILIKRIAMFVIGLLVISAVGSSVGDYVRDHDTSPDTGTQTGSTSTDTAITTTQNSLVGSTGMLSVTSNPTNAKVFVDGVEVGVAPYQNNQIKTGTHTVRCELPGYLAGQQTVTVISAQEAKVDLLLNKDTSGVATITSSPSGAKVTLGNGDLVGTTPIYQKQVPIGTQVFRFEKTGYTTAYQTKSIASGQETKIDVAMAALPTTTTTTPATASIDVSTMPNGASIYIDGVYKGTSRLTTIVPVGTHTVRAELANYKTTTTTAEVLAGRSNWVSMNMDLVSTLTGATGKLYVTSTPSGAGVFVNQFQKGTTPCTLTLPVGQHIVMLQKPGYIDSISFQTVYSGQTTNWNKVMSPTN